MDLGVEIPHERIEKGDRAHAVGSKLKCPVFVASKMSGLGC
jgi:hypothetical protein